MVGQLHPPAAGALAFQEYGIVAGKRHMKLGKLFFIRKPRLVLAHLVAVYKIPEHLRQQAGGHLVYIF